MHIEIIQSGKITSLIINLNSSVLFKRFSALVKPYPWCLPKRDPSEVCKILFFFQVYLLKLFCFVWIQRLENLLVYLLHQRYINEGVRFKEGK